MNTSELRGLSARVKLAQANVQAAIYGKHSPQYQVLLTEAIEEARAIGFGDFDSFCHVEHPIMFRGERILIERWQLGWCESGSSLMSQAHS
ncbi:hypothetical protein V8Z74_14805 [Comamonas sp. w2-DMI]|uniref:hypothetical protein n=1 Tax=Comamonas sp. w2-DMI TaxID=3126391 RepID=UPI0032E518E5